MLLRLVAPLVAVTALGTLVAMVAAGEAWGYALLGGLVAGGFAGVSSLLLIRPLILRIEVLATTLRGAAERAPTDALVAGADELETADRTFNELAERWASRAHQLSQERDTLTAVLDGMAEGIWVTDRDGTVIRHNAALTKLLAPNQRITGQLPLSLIRSTQLNDAVVAASKRGESSQLEVQVEGVRPRTLSVQVMPLGHGLEGSAAVFHDVTDLRRLEKVRKDFVANVSHELRTPITAIRGYAETLGGGALKDAEHAPRMVEIIQRQSERLSALVADLLELSRIESGDVKLETQPVPVAEVVSRAADVVRPKADEKRIAVTNRVDPSAAVVGDARALEQVLLNLLDNAVKYTPAGGRVEVTAAPVGRRVALTVTDTGIGIEEKHLARIFERFYRVDKGRSRDTGGTGLGLAIVKHLTGAMGGEIQVTSRTGVGSNFTVVLPSANANGAAAG